ncbi:MAG: zinc ribbon domain-containing protein [Deltaproteobacteria bacterium]|nr:zinc ribbon domain-containing protein [Deltaproteobacteria bacterium]
MPLFEYRCEACAHLEEVLQKHTDPAPESCPACGKAGTMAKAISLTSFQLKGGGWYKDLYASSANKSESPASTASAAPAPAASSSPAAPSAPSAAPSTSTSSTASTSTPSKSGETKAASTSTASA